MDKVEASDDASTSSVAVSSDQSSDIEESLNSICLTKRKLLSECIETHIIGITKCKQNMN